MIARLRGRVVAREADHLVLEVGGVGYRVFASAGTLAALSPGDAEVSVAIHTLVRDDAIHLYGFVREEERVLFRTLIGVAGIGPRGAVQILSGLPLEAFVRAISEEATDRLMALPGVGKKTAQRLVVELKDRIGELAGALGPAATGAEDGCAAGAPAGTRLEAIAALEALGVTRARAEAALDGAGRRLGADAAVEDWVRGALRELGRP